MSSCWQRTPSRGRFFVSLSNKFYVGTRRYGGYLTYRNSSVGTHVGAERYYDPFVRQWKFRPIVMPFVQVSKKFIIELPLVVCKKKVACLLHVNRMGRPTIVPGRQRGQLKKINKDYCDVEIIKKTCDQIVKLWHVAMTF